ncbi:YmfQ family protein [Bradyrhizobium sp. DASA03120]|uniref:YmfQ family protein n=1 Tax=Bradyrhizobium sp. SMVTL-02 TaxID=3395917 RepID=UPI003F6F28F1
MSDRHIRRAGGDYRDAFLELLPQGQAWPKHSIDSVLWQACDGLNNYWGYVDGRAADLLEIESDPRKTVELLPDWERNWGLPDPCYTAPQTIAERQIALVARMTLYGSQSREFYINFAAFLGYTITITEYRPFMVGIDCCGDGRVYGDGTFMQDQWGRPIMDPNGEPAEDGELSEWPNYGLGPPENRYYWTVHVHQADLQWFRCASGQCGVDPHLRIGHAQDLECILARWKPAHTQIVYDYSGLTPGDPMAGTP